jgi:hypothetical protein
MLAPSSPRRLPRIIVAIALGAVSLAACQAAAGPTTVPTTPTPASASRAPTPAATAAAADLGTITLTDSGCTWAGNPGSIAAGSVRIQAWNETDDYAAFFVHRLHAGKTWADGVDNVAGVVAAIAAGADWPPPVSDVVTEGDAYAGLGDGLDFPATPGTYGVICSANTSPTGDILTVFLVGPLVVSA